MKPEMDEAMAAFVKALGSDYKKETLNGGFENVYWEFEDKGSTNESGYRGGRGGDYALIALGYNPTHDVMTYEIEGESLYKQSQGFTTTKDLIKDLKVSALSYNSRNGTKVEDRLVSKIKRM